MFISCSTLFFYAHCRQFHIKNLLANILPLTGSDGGVLSQLRGKMGADTVQDAQ